MPSGSDDTPPSQIHHRFTSDLLEIDPREQKHSLQGQTLFCVLSDVLSDLDMRTGNIIEMRAIDAGQRLEPDAIVAVRFIWSGVLLLRQFVPPRMLITNSSKGNLPHLLLGRSMKLIAALDQRR